MIFSLTPPPSTPNMEVANTNTPSHRERDENYAYIVVQLAPRYRVILCPQGLQWIIQEKEASHEAPWRAEQPHRFAPQYVCKPAEFSVHDRHQGV